MPSDNLCNIITIGLLSGWQGGVDIKRLWQNIFDILFNIVKTTTREATEKLFVTDWRTQTSAFDEYGRSWHISGATQLGVPTNVDARSTVVVSRLAMPKSPVYTHTHTHPFNGPFSGTTRVSRYQKGKTNLDFTKARDSEWQWHQLGHMQVCTSLHTDNHASTTPLSFLQAGCPSCCTTNSVKALKALNAKITGTQSIYNAVQH